MEMYWDLLYIPAYGCCGARSNVPKKGVYSEAADRALCISTSWMLLKFLYFLIVSMRALSNKENYVKISDCDSALPF